MENSSSQFWFDAVHEYDDPATGEGRRRLSGHYRVYDRETFAYLGYIARVDTDRPTRLRWRTIIPNPEFVAGDGVGFIGDRYIGRHANPRAVARWGETRNDIAKVLARHWADHPDLRLVEARPACEELVTASG